MAQSQKLKLVSDAPVKTAFLCRIVHNVSLADFRVFFADYEPGGRKAGTASVTFSNSAAFEQCLELEGGEFMGRNIHLSAEKPKPKEPGSSVYIRGFDESWEKEDVFQALRAALGDYGRARIRVPTDRDTNAVKGFAFAEFNDPETRVSLL